MNNQLPEIQTFKFSTINNVNDPASIDWDKGECVDICNMDMTNDTILARRAGYVKDIDVAAHSGWNSSKDGYYVSGNTLYQYPNVVVASVSGAVCYADLGDMIVYGSDSGIGFYPLYSSSPTNDLDNEYEMPIASHRASALAYWNGRLYWLEDGWLCCSKPFKFDVYDYREYRVAYYPEGASQIWALNSGMYLGSSDKMHFISGSDAFADDFKQQIALNYGVMPGRNGSIVPASYYDKGQSERCVVFTSLKGICIGFEGGQVINASQNILTYPTGTSAGDIVMTDSGANIYITNINNDNNLPFMEVTEYTIDVNDIDVST